MVNGSLERRGSANYQKLNAERLKGHTMQASQRKTNGSDETLDKPSKAFEDMLSKWELPEALLTGTFGMQEEATRWLPREPKETYPAYQNRLNRTFLFNAYSRTLKALAGMPFSRSTVIEGLPEELQYIKSDADSTGRSLTNFAYSLLQDQIHYGISHYLIEMPYFDVQPTLEEQSLYNIRPYFVKVSPKEIIGWSTQKYYGLQVLTGLKIKEKVCEGEWGSSEVDQIRICYPDRYEIWREEEAGKGNWILINSMKNQLGYIPLVTAYGNRTGFMQGEPALSELAELNLQHYQQSSDLNNIMHVANVPFLFGSGFDDGEMEGVEIGPNRLITNSDTGARLQYVEHSGSAIGKAMEAISKLEERMAAVGADLIIRKSVDRQTATSRKIDQSETVSLLQMMVNNLELALHKGIRIAADWLDIELGNLIVDIGESIDVAESPNGIDIMLNMLVDHSGLNVEDVQAELLRRGVLADTFKIGMRGTDKSSQPKGTEGNQEGNTQP